jgi:hypothetical protein
MDVPMHRSVYCRDGYCVSVVELRLQPRGDDASVSHCCTTSVRQLAGQT